MTIFCICFTKRGQALGERIAAACTKSGDAFSLAIGWGPRKTPLADFTKQAWKKGGALLFIGAAGIAVRAIAPLLESKAEDPAVLVLDENGKYCVPILSGHLGGANALARKVAAICGAVPVVTTATDGRGLFAVDTWAKREGLRIQNLEKAKAVSAKLLSGQEISIQSEFPISGAAPAGVRVLEGPAPEKADVFVGVHTPKDPQALHLVPRCLTLGAGCRKGTAAETLERALGAFLSRVSVAEAAISAVRSLDLKKDEPGLLAFCAAHGWPLETFSAAELRAQAGTFTKSAFVARTVGVDNVCERAAVLGGGDVFVSKTVFPSVTLALGVFPPALHF